jgi:hypothetical protein
MNVQRDPDAVLAAWLEEGPNRLPELTRRAISFTTRTTEQKRRSTWVPWRTPLMPTYARIAFATVAVIAMLGGAAYFIGPQQHAGGPTPSPSPSVTAAPSSAPPSLQAQATGATDWTTSTSSRFAYTFDHPASWSLTPANFDWPKIGLPEKGGWTMDVFRQMPTGIEVYITSVPVASAKDAAALLAEFDAQNTAFCNSTSNRHDITLDGVTMRQEDQVCAQSVQVVEVLGASKDRFFEINLVTSVDSPLTATDRATFDRILASFKFGT